MGLFNRIQYTERNIRKLELITILVLLINTLYVFYGNRQNKSA